MKNLPKSKWTRGFTLIELLVVIAILGILATISITSFAAAPKRARDAQRKSDLNQYRLALENYANDNNGLYPAPQGVGGEVAINAYDLCDPTNANAPLKQYMGSCLNDPKNPNDVGWRYRYIANASGTFGNPLVSKYALHTCGATGAAAGCGDGGGLESTQGTRWAVCSNGNVGMASNSYNDVKFFCGM